MQDLSPERARDSDELVGTSQKYDAILLASC
jgi:hypothetical protein